MSRAICRSRIRTVLPLASGLDHALVDEADRPHFHRALLELTAHAQVFELHLLGHGWPAVLEGLLEVVGVDGRRSLAALADRRQAGAPDHVLEIGAGIALGPRRDAL